MLIFAQPNGPGVTPFASILKHIWYRQRNGNLGSLRRVEFFWVCRDAPSFGWFQSLLQEVEAAQADRQSLHLTSFSWHQTEIIYVLSQLPPHQHLPHPEDQRRHVVEHRHQRRRCRV